MSLRFQSLRYANLKIIYRLSSVKKETIINLYEKEKDFFSLDNFETFILGCKRFSSPCIFVKKKSALCLKEETFKNLSC